MEAIIGIISQIKRNVQMDGGGRFYDFLPE